jgi:hypothetical protein
MTTIYLRALRGRERDLRRALPPLAGPLDLRRFPPVGMFVSYTLGIYIRSYKIKNN